MENPWRRRVFGLCVFVAILAVCAGPAFAQEEEAEGQEQVAEESAARPVVIEEIVVTAQKRTENIQDVPISLSTLQGEDLEVITTGGVDIRALSARVPSEP